MVDLAVDIGGLRLANPVMPASGTFSDGLARVIDFNRLGAFVIKTVTRELRAGNPTPRVAETAGGMLNSIGIPSKGIDYFFDETLPFYKRFKPPLVVSISAPTADGFASLATELGVSGVAAIEANISCPNLEEDGRAFAMTPHATASVVARLRAATKLPLWVKLTPNTGDIADVARAAEANGADAVVVANTILAMSIDVATFRPRLGSVTGGLSGPAVKPVILRQVYQCARAVKIDIVGCGGIATGADAVEYMLAGASAVQIGTATFIHPTALIRVIDEIEEFCNHRGFSRISALTGALMRAGVDETDLEWRQEAGE
ncbi:MAG: dihydroorotate dehydrogenase [Alphaproteobacteria bacterium]|nr:dihydroorotate dehydrogenase [Alphaproteobacteria bacterium]